MRIVLTVVLLLCGFAPHVAAQAAAPNVVFILADDLGFGDPGCYNADSKIPTPHIDALEPSFFIVVSH